jgi:hypothetical protein
MTTSDDTSLRKKLQRIDENTRSEHPCLLSDDLCFYFGEKLSPGGFERGPTNQLIFNLKKPMELKNQKGWGYKQDAIETASKLIGNTIGTSLSIWTFVPIPPSKPKLHPLFDDRITQILSKVTNQNGERAQILEMVVQTGERDAAHLSSARPTVDELRAMYHLDLSLIGQAKANICIFDDVITNGTSFRVASDLIRAQLPNATIRGLFIARNVHKEPNPFIGLPIQT